MTNRWCLVPKTRCQFAKKKTKKRYYCENINLETWKILAGPRVNVYGPATVKCPQENFLRFAACKQQADVLDANGQWRYRFLEIRSQTLADNYSVSIMADQNRIAVTSQTSTRLRRSRQQVSNPVSSIIHGCTLTLFNK